MATPILEIPEVSTSILSFALLNIVLRHYEQAASNRIINSLTTPPAAPADGDAYFVLSGATGLWSGQSGKIAFSISGAWYFMKAIPKLPYFKSSTNTLVTLDPVTATEGVFSSGGGSAGLTVADEGTNLGTASTVTTLDFVGAGVTATRSGNVVSVSVPGSTGGGGASYYDIVAGATGTVFIPFNSYPAHAVVFVDCSAVTTNSLAFNLVLSAVTGTSGGKKIEIIFFNAPSQLMYVYRSGSDGGYSIPSNPNIYRSDDYFFATYDINFTTGTLIVHNTSRPTDVFESGNYSIPNVDEVVVDGRHRSGVYSYSGNNLSSGAATLTLTWDDFFITNTYVDLNWTITIHDLPSTVTSVIVAPPAGSSTSVLGNLAKTPSNGTVLYQWIFSTYWGAWIVT